MKHFILAMAVVMLTAVSMPAYAQSVKKVDLSGLTEKQKAELIIRAEDLKAASQSKPTEVAEDVLKWANMGQGIGKALVATAKELGVEVNAFAETFVGKLSVFLIVWHFFGGMVVHVIGGFAILLWTLPIWIWSFKRHATLQVLEVVEAKEKGGKTVKTTTYEDPFGQQTDSRGKSVDHRGGNAMIHWLILAVIFIVSIVTTFTW